MKTYKLFSVIAILALLFAALPVLRVEAAAYNNVTIYNWGKGNAPDIWDLTAGDLTLSYTLNLSEITTPGWAIVEVGLREVGAPNLDPNDQGGWMQSNYNNGSSNPLNINNNDMHLLSKHGWLYQNYDAQDPSTLITPYWSGNNYGFWFDRDGVDQWQAEMWGMADTYNTAGVYEIVLEYHAIDANTGTIFATINGVQQGLYIGGWKNAQPEFYPAGRSFTGDMTQMQVFWGRGGGGGAVNISGITVAGVLANTPPDCSAAYASVDILWPPLHQMVGVDVLGVTDPDGDAFSVTIDSIWQDEPVNNTGDGNTAPDGEGVGTSMARLRAERDGGGNGRVYHVGFSADDGNGGTCTGTFAVNVPKSMGKKGAAVDDGALFDSTIP